MRDKYLRDPYLMERVRLRNQEGLFLVTRIDAQSRVVNLIPLLFGSPVEVGVSFDDLEFLSERPNSPLFASER